MRELNFLHFHPGDSCWHHHDPRLKLLELLMWSALALSGNMVVTGSIITITVLIMIMSRSGLRRLRKPLIFWIAMASVFIITSGTADDGIALSVSGWISPLGRQGVTDGVQRALKLLAVLLAGQLLAATTDPSDLASALRRLTVFLPKTWSAAIATGLSLTISFIPVMMDDAATVRDAAASRGLSKRRGLIRRAVSLGLPMAEAALRRADLTSDALISRSYSADPTPTEMTIGKRDIAAFALVTLIPAFGLLWPTVQGQF